ncbi:MAG: hypothetical protein DMG08_26590 [Acidobacteria bacterium]|nr:MAG: hypothetical protein DMG08_26590 [Acidobacteriota bacterium]
MKGECLKGNPTVQKTILALLVFVSFSWPAFSQIYKWKDKDGNIIMSTTPPPPGVASEKKEVEKDRPGPKTTAAVSANPATQDFGFKRPYKDVKVIIYVTDASTSSSTTSRRTRHKRKSGAGKQAAKKAFLLSMWKARSRWALARTVFEPQSKKSEHPGSSANSLRSSKAPLRLCVFVVKAGHAASTAKTQRRKESET